MLTLDHRTIACGSVLVLLGTATHALAEWQPAKGPLMTRWAKDVSPDKVHPEYPRPQMVRKDWLNLNGLWDYAIRPREEQQPEAVRRPDPRAVPRRVGPLRRDEDRSATRTASGIAARSRCPRKGPGRTSACCCTSARSTGSAPSGSTARRSARTRAATTRSRSTSPKALAKSTSGQHELVVAVWDPTDAGCQPRGKQVAKPARHLVHARHRHLADGVARAGAGRRTSVAVRIVPDIDNGDVRIRVDCERPERPTAGRERASSTATRRGGRQPGRRQSRATGRTSCRSS